ncbi:MAG: PAS domain S-box protein, partial [Patescibacteria group bacterium]
MGIILTSGVSFIFYRYNFDKIVKEKTHILKIISDAVAGPLLTFREPLHPLIIENVFQKSLEVPGVMFVRSFDSANKTIIISSDPRETGIKIENLPELKRDISIRDSIFNGEKIKEFSVKARDGTNLWMGFSFKDTEKDILINAVVLGVSAALLIIITVLVIFFIFRRFLITPFLSLSAAFEKLKNKDYETRLADSPISEIQKIFQSFNEMVQNLSNSYQSLKSAEMETKKSEKLFRSLLDSAPLCIKWFDKNGGLISINKSGREEHYLEGKTEEEIKNWKYLDSIDEAYRPMVKEKMDSALIGETSSFEMKHAAGASREQWCAAEITPVKNDDGDISNILFISRGLTKEKMINAEREKNIKKT